MSLSGKQWVWPDHDQARVDEMIEILGFSPALARLLLNRGISDPEQARAFLCPSLDQFHPPWELAGMQAAVERLIKALKNDEKIVVHGDYDADGIAAAAIVVEALRSLGARVDYYLPSRFGEGYGLHLEPLKQFKDDGFTLVITVDCGINAVEEVRWAAENGLDMIVTDHHLPLAPLKGALAVINPLQENCPYPFKTLSGAGIAFKMVSALMEKLNQPFPEHLLDLAALGTTADVVPLLGENRIIVYYGLQVLRRMRRVGFKALAEAVSLDEQRITSTSLSFVLAPAINAAGRMGEAVPAAELVLEAEPSRARDLAETLHRANQLRRAVEQNILLEAEEAAIDILSESNQKVITLAGSGWHHGVIGIVASRLVDQYSRPFCLIALEGEEGRGSARSIRGFDITAALAECSSNLERFGGHEQAAGFTIKSDRVGVLSDCLNRYASINLEDSDLKPRLYIEAELEDSEIDFDLTSRLEQLQPHGTANPAPLFASRNWQILSWRLVGADQQHLKLRLKKDNRTLDPIVFSGSFLAPKLEEGRRVDLALKLKNGYFRDQKTLEAEVKDLRYSDSFKSGSFEVIDRRDCNNRLAVTGAILDRHGGNGVVFASTSARSEEINKGCFLNQPPRIVTSGSVNNNSKPPGEFDFLIIYDLPLYEGILQHIFSGVSKEKSLKIYLLYGREDTKRNRRMLDISLPSAGDLEKIAFALDSTSTADAAPVFPGAAEGKLGFKPAPSFWERAEKILAEIGLLADHRITGRWPENRAAWPSCLEASPTYLSTRALREQCEIFQERLLEAESEEIASLLRDLPPINDTR